MGELAQFEDLLLRSARNGDHKTVNELLKARDERKADLDVNCKGQSKYNLGWTPLHLSSYFGHKKCAEILLQNGANVDVLNESGDTPLHKAALTDREDLVMLLLEHGASVSIINGEGLKASDQARRSQTKKLIIGAERAEQKSREGKLLHASREGHTDEVKQILQEDLAPNINCIDGLGNTPLHCAAYRGHINITVVLLQNGCDPTIKNVSGQTALDMVQSQQMQQVLAVPPVRSFYRSATRFEGPLLRRVRIVGWRMVWAVLERGVLTFFSSRADASSGVGRRDYKYLDGAKVVPAIGGDQAIFFIQFSDRTRYKLAALMDPVHSACVNRQKWVSSVEDHIKFSTYYIKHGFSIETEDEDDDEERDFKPLGCMEDALTTSKAHQELMEQQVQEVIALISYLEDESLKQGSIPSIIKKFSALSSTARNMASSLSHCLSLLKQQEEVRELQLKEEKEKVRVLEESLRVLATEHHDLEESIAIHVISPPSEPSLYNTPANSCLSLPKHRRLYNSLADDEFYDVFSHHDGDADTLRSISPCDSECSTNTLVSCMSSLPTDPHSPPGDQTTPIFEYPNLSSLTSVTPMLSFDWSKGVVQRGTGDLTYTKIPGEFGPDSKQVELMDKDFPMITAEAISPGGDSTLTISSGSCQQSLQEGSSSPFTISLTNSHEDPISKNISTLPTKSPSSQFDSECTSLSALSPATPLVRTSDLSEHEDSKCMHSHCSSHSSQNDDENELSNAEENGYRESYLLSIDVGGTFIFYGLW